MIILFPRRKGVKIVTKLIFEEIGSGASFQYVMGMIDLAAKVGAITKAEKAALIQYLQERG